VILPATLKPATMIQLKHHLIFMAGEIANFVKLLSMMILSAKRFAHINQTSMIITTAYAM
jgi:hypothetical protein